LEEEDVRRPSGKAILRINCRSSGFVTSLVHNGDKEIVNSLATMLESLLLMTASKGKSGKKSVDAIIRGAWKKRQRDVDALFRQI